MSMRQQNSTRGCFLLSRLARILFILSGKNAFKATGTRPFFHILLESIEVFFHCRLSVTGVRQYHRRLPSYDSFSLPSCSYGSGLGGCGPPPSLTASHSPSLSSFSSQTRGWISRPKSSYIKHCCHFLCYRLLSVLKSIKRLNSIYLSGLDELLTWGDWRIFWFKLWIKANPFLYCTLIDISLRWFNSSWVVNKSWKTFKLKASGSVILYSISFYSLALE